jgi:hypothetical protein
MSALPISIVVSDPWDVGEAVNWEAISGYLLETRTIDGGGRVLIKFDQCITYRDRSYCYAVASPRLEGRNISEIEAGKTVGCAITGISDEQAVSPNPMDTSKWRGGFAFVGDIKRR